MLKQVIYTKKIKNENYSNTFQYGHLYIPAATRTQGNLTSSNEFFHRGYGLFHGIPQEIPSIATDNEVRVWLPAVFTKKGRNEKSSHGFPLEALSLIINWLCGFKERILMCNQFLFGTQN